MMELSAVLARDDQLRPESSVGSATCSDDYSDSCSSSECSSSSSWSSGNSIPEWESHIDSHGELFYVQFTSSSNLQQQQQQDANVESSRQQQVNIKKKKKSRLSRLLKRRQKSGSGNGSGGATCESPVYLPTGTHDSSPADDWSDWSFFTLELQVHPSSVTSTSSPHRSGGRRRTGGGEGGVCCEDVLGFVAGVPQCPDWHGQVSFRQRVIVEKLIPGGPLHQGGFAHVQQGDWLEKLNGRTVTHRDLNDILSGINSKEIVELNFRRRPPPPSASRNYNHHHQESSEQQSESSSSSLLLPCESPSLPPPYGLLLLSQENVTETSPELADILYHYPPSAAGTELGSAAGGGPAQEQLAALVTSRSASGSDSLLKWRGAGITLVHLMPQLTGGSVPLGSTVVCRDGGAIHLAYVIEQSTTVLLLAAPATWCSNLELQMMAKQLGSLLHYQYGSIRSGLTDIRWSDEVGRTVDSLFNIWLQPPPPLYCATAAVGVTAKQQEMNSGRTRLANCFITSGQWLPLPTECQLDVTLTLNQMEAMDYEDWDEEAISVQRCTTIIGSAVYCQGYLVASTLSGDKLEDVGTFLKWNQILEMSVRRTLSNLIIWRQVFPPGSSSSSRSRSFIAVVGTGHVLLVALLECGGAADITQPWDNYPDTFLIEEMQFYLQELEYLQLETTCNQILNGPHNPVLVTNLGDSSATSDEPTNISAFNVTSGSKPTLINYLSMDFGTGAFIGPTLQAPRQIKFVDQFKKTALTIHKLFEQTLKAKTDLQRSDWGGPWSDKSLVALQEVSVLFRSPSQSPTTTTQNAAQSSPNGTKVAAKDQSYWVTGRLFTAPSHRELFVCYQEGVEQDIVDLAFHLGFSASLL